ncbi:hypothetical protein ACS3QZ_08620 [Shimia sp. W99]
MIRAILTTLILVSACPVQAELRFDRTDEDEIAGANGNTLEIFS